MYPSGTHVESGTVRSIVDGVVLLHLDWTLSLAVGEGDREGVWALSSLHCDKCVAIEVLRRNGDLCAACSLVSVLGAASYALSPAVDPDIPFVNDLSDGGSYGGHLSKPILAHFVQMLGFKSSH